MHEVYIYHRLYSCNQPFLVTSENYAKYNLNSSYLLSIKAYSLVLPTFSFYRKKQNNILFA